MDNRIDDGISTDRIADQLRRDALSNMRSSNAASTIEPIDTATAAILQAKLVSHDEMAVHRREAARSGIKVPEYLLHKHIISRGDYYQALALLNKDGIAVGGQRELPEWNVIINSRGQELEGGQDPSDILVLGLTTEISAGKKQVFVLTTSAAAMGVRYSALFSHLSSKGYRVRAKLIADPGLIEVVRSEWATRSGHSQKGHRTESEQHALWHKIIKEAKDLGASDIHLGGSLGRGELKYRVHGELEIQPMDLTEDDAVSLAQAMYNTMVDKGSTGAGFNSRIEQDAVITTVMPDGQLRLRYIGYPVEPSGINVILRLIPIDAEAKPKSPPTLGYAEDQSDLLERIFARSSGLILFLGTTGSGKSTSMANMLMRKVLDNPGKQLRTIEQPVEIRIPGANVSQTSVLGSDFSKTMSAMMRADPDYLMVGEIRDKETAALALQAVRSGHLCISTLHADGAPIAFDRLAGLGVLRSDLASVGLVAGLIYQRLVPVLCRHCRVPAADIASEKRSEYVAILRRLRVYLGADGSFEGIYFRSERGCLHCKYRGVEGRTVCAEIMVPKARMLKAIADNDSPEIWNAWRSEIDPDNPELMRGRTAFEHALLKMRKGICSPQDVEREFKYLDEPVIS